VVLELSVNRISYLTNEGRKLCQFTTPDILAEAMAHWAITSADDSILDPCCGNSNLLEKGMDRLLALGATPRKAARQTYGIEISARTARIAAANLLNKYGPSIPNVIKADFLKTKPGDIPLFTAIMCNPPYKRHQSLGKRYKTEIAKMTKQESGISVPMTSNQYVHFLFHSLSFLASGGRMVFLLPSQYLTNGFGRALRNFLGTVVRIHHVILFDERLPVFPNSMSTASLIFVERSTPRLDWTTDFAKLDSVQAVSDYLRDEDRTEKVAATVRTVPQRTLVRAEKWIGFFSKTAIQHGTKTLADIAEVKRGIATGANGFFFLTDTEAKANAIPLESLRPILVRAHDAPYPDFGKWDWAELKREGKRVWMLDCRIQKQDLGDPNLLRYIESGEAMQYHKRYLTSHRNPWYRPEKRSPARILFTYMSNGRPRFIYNKGRILTSNAFHSVYPKWEISSDMTRLKALLAFLNSSHTSSKLALIGRTYSGGLLKLEPSEAEAIPVPDLGTFGEENLQRLSKLFDDLCRECRRSGSWDTSEIDRLIRSLTKAA